MAATDFAPTLKLAEQWLQVDPNQVTKKHVKTLLRHAAEGLESAKTELARLMAPRVAFGTAGLRALMGPGFARINQVTAVQVARGVMRHLIAQQKDSNAIVIVIGYDHRASPEFGVSSRKLAQFCAAAVLAEHPNKVKVVLSKTYGPTPMVPFAVRHLGASCGIMITASHNPREYNGLKVYGANGCLVCSPEDSQIVAHIDAVANESVSSGVLGPWDQKVFSKLSEDPYAFGNAPCVDLSEAISVAYLARMRTWLNNELSVPDELLSKVPKTMYTAMHGVAGPMIFSAFAEAGLTAPRVVDSQFLADPDFPTVKFPNPEEGLLVLRRAIDAAERQGCTLLLANDPDGDRLAVAERIDEAYEKVGENEPKWRVFTGNQIGMLLADFLYTRLRETKAAGSNDLVALNTLVSSNMLSCWANVESSQSCDLKVSVQKTQTGFKNLGNLAYKINQEAKEGAASRVFFAYEEAIGFMCDPVGTCDKDGITAAVAISLAAAARASTSANRKDVLYTRLCQLYQRAGYFQQSDSYVSTEGQAPGIAGRVFSRLEETNPRTLGASGHRVESLVRAQADMVQCMIACVMTPEETQMANEHRLLLGTCRVTLRSSGTEPKLKHYIELQVLSKQQASDGCDLAPMRTLATSVLRSVTDAVRSDWLNFTTL